MASSAVPTINLAVRNYDSVQPISLGDVRSDAVDVRLRRGFDALIRTDDPEMDGGERSFSRYLQALAQGDRSVVGLPVFPMRGFRQRCFFVHKESALRDVADLAGLRVGINEWPATGNTWARAVLRERGLDIWSIRWLVGQVSVGYKVPPDEPLPTGVGRQSSDRLLVDMLAAGEIDALCCPWPPPEFYEPNSPIRRLYPDFRRVEQEYFSRTGIFPVHHIIVVKRAWVDRYPERVGAVYRLFEESRSYSLQTHRSLAETLPWLLAELEEDTRLMGADIQPSGLQENRVAVAVLCEELYAQGLVPRRLDPLSAFAEFESLANV